MTHITRRELTALISGALAGTVVPVAAAALFAITIHTRWPGMVFAVGAVMLVGSAAALRRLRPAHDRHRFPVGDPVA